MTCSVEQLAANRLNSQKSSGPRTEEGKEASRRNSLKHGLTGEGVVQSPGDDAATKELSARLRVEMRPTSQVARFLVDRLARFMVRLERCAGLDRLMFDEEGGFASNPEAILAWKYEMAAERGMFRTLKELREVEGQANPAAATAYLAASSRELASFSPPPRQAPGPAPSPSPRPTAAPLLAARPDSAFPRTTYLPDLADNFVPISAARKG